MATDDKKPKREAPESGAKECAALSERLNAVESSLRAHAAEPHPPKPARRPMPFRHTEYTVKRGDTLSRIAQVLLGNAGRFKEITALNGLKDPNQIFVGQVLKIPAR